MSTQFPTPSTEVDDQRGVIHAALQDAEHHEGDPPTPAEYDATGRQRIPVLLSGEEGLIKVALIFDPCAGGKPFDSHLREYVRLLTTVRATDTALD